MSKWAVNEHNSRNYLLRFAINITNEKDFFPATMKTTAELYSINIRLIDLEYFIRKIVSSYMLGC